MMVVGYATKLGLGNSSSQLGAGEEASPGGLGRRGARWLCRPRKGGVKGRNQLQTRAQGPNPIWKPDPAAAERGEGLRTRHARPLAPGPGARPHRPRPRPTLTCWLAGTTRRRPTPAPPSRTADAQAAGEHPRPHRHRSSTIPAATPATTSFRAKTGSRDPPEPGKRLKEHCVMTSAPSACPGGGPKKEAPPTPPRRPACRPGEQPGSGRL